jgi:hypothetical protein
VEVEVVDVSLDYNMLLGRSWTYSMKVVISTIFQIICFPHEGRIVTIDQVVSNLSDVTASPRTIIPVDKKLSMETESIGCGMYPLLMGSFDFFALISYVHATSIGFHKLGSRTFVNRVTSFRMSYMHDPWMLPSPSSSVEGRVHVGMDEPLSAVEVSYQAIQRAMTDPDQTPSVTEEDDLFPEPVWAQNSSSSQDCLDTIFPSDEAIIEEMVGAERPWGDMHQRSYFLPELSHVENGEFKSAIIRSVDRTVNPLARHGVYAEGNMANISETIPINISRNLDVM